MDPRQGPSDTNGRPAISLGWEQVSAWRLRRHHLHRRVPHADLPSVVADVAGLHAQLMSSAALTLWARVEDLEPGAVPRALWEERSLVKTWAMRGTLHLLPAAEFRMWQAAQATRSHYLKGGWLRAFGVTRDQLEQLMTAVGQALDGRMLTREELADEVTRLTGSAGLGDKLRGSWGALLKPAAYRGHLCFAPNQGRHVRFTHPGRWLDHWDARDPDDSLRAITRRFLAASGPVTRDDYARWWGTTPVHAGKLIEQLDGEVTRVDVDGTPAWMLDVHASEAAQGSAPRVVRLLPAFDQFVVTATRHATHLLPGPFKDRIYRPQGWLSPVLLVNGRMEGIWRHETKGPRLHVRIEPFTELPAWSRRAAEEEAERLARHLAGQLELTWTTPG